MIQFSEFVSQALVPTIIATALAGIIIKIVRIFYRFMENKAIEGQYPIVGEYITVFYDEDYLDGGTVTKTPDITSVGKLVEMMDEDKLDNDIQLPQTDGGISDKSTDRERKGEDVFTAYASLDQRGSSVSGVSSVNYPDYQAKWDLHGEITDEGFFKGEYEAANPHNSGKGVFFLDIDRLFHMEGIWIGYEAGPGEIAYGKYEYDKILDVNIQEVTSLPHPPIIRLLEETNADSTAIQAANGTKYDSKVFTAKTILNGPDMITRLARNIYNRLYGGSPAAITPTTWDNQIDPVGTIVISECNDENQYDDLLQVQLPESISCSNNIGVIQHIGVKDGYQGQGVGTKLIRHVKEKLEDCEYDIICITMTEKQFQKIAGILQSLDFEEVHTTGLDDDNQDETYMYAYYFN